MRSVTLAALLAALLCAAPAAAQEQRGAIEGIVKDASGSVIPGVSVEARSAALIGVASTVTDTSGVYRFPALPPGIYEVTATMQGFAPAKVADVELLLGQIKKVDLGLKLAGVTESVDVTSEGSLIDVKSSSAGANIRSEFTDKLPKGRDFTSVVTLAPGANDESKLGGISIDGASGSENRFLIDGVDTTSLRMGTSAQGMRTEMIEEVQVKSSGYNAEFGGATGGVISAISKSGSNIFHGSLGGEFNSSGLNGDSRPTLRLGLTNNQIAEYITFPKDDATTTEPSMTLGGPVMRDRLWFFGSYAPQIVSTDRTVTFTANNQTATVRQKHRQHFMTGNVIGQLLPNLRSKFSASASPSYRDGILPNQNGTQSPTTPFSDNDLTTSQTSYSGNFDYVASQRLFVSARGGYFTTNTVDPVDKPDELWYIFNFSNIGMPGVPASLQQANGYSNLSTNFQNLRDKYTRLSLSADATYYATAAGQHTFKAGVQYDKLGNDVFIGWRKPQINLFWGQTYQKLDGSGSVTGAFGYYHIADFGTIGDVSVDNIGLFVQDSWTLNKRLTLNVGVRTEKEKVPSYNELPGYDFSFGQKLAPRLGFAYDLRGDGRWKAYGSWGLFYDMTKLELPRGAFGGDKWVQYHYTLDTPDWTSIQCAAGPSGCPGTFIEQFDRRHPSNDLTDPDIDPMRAQEFTLGLDHELNARTSVGVRYVHKQIDRAIEDIGFVDPSIGAEVFSIGNPGYGRSTKAFGDVDLPQAVRDYDGVEVRLRRRFGSNLSFQTSYLWSRLYGNYSGLASSDENGRTSPNVNRFFDAPHMTFDEDVRPTLGLLPTDRPHQFKVNGFYQFKFGTSVGANYFLESGTPTSRQITLNSAPFYYRGRGSEGRTPALSQTDLLVQHGFRIGGAREIVAAVNVLNLFDQDTVTNVFNTYNRTNLAITNEQFFAGIDTEALMAARGIQVDPRFGQANTYQAPRQVRFSLKLVF